MNAQERGKERYSEGYHAPAARDYPNAPPAAPMGSAVPQPPSLRSEYERGYNDAMAEPREWSDDAVEAAAEALWFAVDDGAPPEEIATWADVYDGTKADLRREARAALIAADKAERERVQHG